METITLNEFISKIGKTKSEKAKSNFLKKNSNGYKYCDYTNRKNLTITSDDVENLVEMVGNNQSVYNYFNKIADPHNIIKKEISRIKEKVESNNIYDKMCAPQVTTYEGSFDIRMNMSIIKVILTWSKDTTLSQSDVYRFM